jgi:hypothetical protein
LGRLQRFHNCCTPEPPPPSGLFLKKGHLARNL